MKHKFIKINTFLILGLGAINLNAQTLNVKEKNSLTTSFQLKGVRKLQFTSGNLAIQKTDNSTKVFGLNNIGYIDFTSITTGNELQLIENANIDILSPNPVIDLLKINLIDKENDVFIEILNLEGKIIHSAQSQGVNEVNINLSHLNKGIYLCRLTNGLAIRTVKIIKL